ncbi:MAG: RES family NAD+ phosphorylase [Bacteroidota bacterium]|nr:RES family NAD+ phosphorylase [Bacteroidota bacterium]
MVVYRIGRTIRADDLTGEGSRLNGGRWNHKLTPCIYTSESRALALLEYTVNVSIDEIPRALSFTTFEIPDAGIQEVTEEELPGNWKDVPVPSSAKDFGTALLKKEQAPVFKIPSIVITQEYNYILNPLHADSRNFKILDIKDFVFDVRIKLQ